MQYNGPAISSSTIVHVFGPHAVQWACDFVQHHCVLTSDLRYRGVPCPCTAPGGCLTSFAQPPCDFIPISLQHRMGVIRMARDLFLGEVFLDIAPLFDVTPDAKSNVP